MKETKFQYPNLTGVQQVNEKDLKKIKGGCFSCTTCSTGGSTGSKETLHPIDSQLQSM